MDNLEKLATYTVNREILVMVLLWPILAPKYKVPKLNTPKYVTLQKLTAKIEHCLNIFLYSLVCTFLSYTSFQSKTLSITIIHLYIYTHTSQTEKCSRCEIVGLDDKRENTGK
jgi:hypothetical protein